MPDLTTIGAVLSSLKTATDIAKFLRGSDLSLERAELKLKLADLLGSLADAKVELVEVQESLVEKDKKLEELEEAFRNRDTFVRHHDAYYTRNENGGPTGVAHCLRCWESEHKKRQLVRDVKSRLIRVCTSCGHQFQSHLAENIQATEEESPETVQAKQRLTSKGCPSFNMW